MPRLAASNSFSEEEINLFDFILKTIVRGGDLRIAARHKSFGTLMRKCLKMQKSIEASRARAEAKARVVTTATPVPPPPEPIPEVPMSPPPAPPERVSSVGFEGSAPLDFEPGGNNG